VKTWVRVFAGLSLVALLWFVGVYLGLWDVALLVLLGAGLGGVIARPKAPAKFRPDTWRRAQNEFVAQLISPIDNPD
jgi:hypothetical protein